MSEPAPECSSQTTPRDHADLGYVFVLRFPSSPGISFVGAHRGGYAGYFAEVIARLPENERPDCRISFEILIADHQAFLARYKACPASRCRGNSPLFDMDVYDTQRHLLEHVIGERNGMVIPKTDDKDLQVLRSLIDSVGPERVSDHVAHHVCQSLDTGFDTREVSSVVHEALCRPERVKGGPVETTTPARPELLH